MPSTLAVASALSLAACVPLPRGRVWDSRVVSSKLAGDVLVSREGLVCSVPSTVYSKMQIGFTHRCVWSPVKVTTRNVRPPTPP